MDVALRLRTVGRPAQEARAPLLVVLDGPDYVSRARLLAVLRRQVEAGALPAHRVALVHADDRFEAFSASARYGRALAATLDELGRGRRVGVGASLGALALLHVHRLEPRAFAGLFLQSGSFFVPRFDRHESAFQRYGRIVRFVRGVLGASGHDEPLLVAMTCGAGEENLHNNRLMAGALAAQGYAVSLADTAGEHDWTAWRDALHPHLTRLLAELWPAR
jgi:enterochelin esterase-like enzyme